MSKQNNRGRGTQGATPAQETQVINTPVVETSTLVSAVVGETTVLRKNTGEQLVSTDKSFANPAFCDTKQFEDVRVGDIVIRNFNDNNPTINLVIRDGVYYTFSTEKPHTKTVLTLELSSHDKVERGYTPASVAAKREITKNAFCLSTALKHGETLQVLRISEELRALIIAGLEIAQCGVGSEIEAQDAKGAKTPFRRPIFHVNYAVRLVPYLRDTFETFEARVRTLLDPTLPAVEAPAIPIKEAKVKSEKPLTEAQIKRAAKKAEKAKTTQTVTTETPGVENLDAPKTEALIPTPELVEVV